jgi:Ulp1 family protease
MLNNINNISINSEDLIYGDHDKKCAPGKVFESGSCISLNVLISMAKAFNEEQEQESNKIILHKNFETLNRTKYKKYLLLHFKKHFDKKCDTHHCWLEQPFVERMHKLEKEELDKYTFRPSGTEGKFEWLSTIHLNDVMGQYEIKYSDYKWLGAVPIDFDDILQFGIKNLNFQDLINKNKTKIGIIFNLDESWQSGSHWVASFANLTEGLIYYYDSYGTHPENRIRKFLRRIAQFCKSELNIDANAEYNKIRHQYGGSECGVYSLNFILRLLKGDTFEQICEDKTPDEEINKCRKVYFR